jgi:hypothetical protein
LASAAQVILSLLPLTLLPGVTDDKALAVFLLRRSLWLFLNPRLD